MNAIIPDIDTLKKVVKINASIPEDSISPYINDALDLYIEPEVGNVIIDIAEDGEDSVLIDKIRRALGPLTMALATDEFGIQYGDSGITVENNQGKRSPANEAKISAAKQSLFFRGMQALDRLLEYLERNITKYPDYEDHIRITQRVQCFIVSANDYQDIGLVNIEHSILTYRTLLPTVLQLQERIIRTALKEGLYERLLSGSLNTTKSNILKELVIRFLANKTAELFTSQTTRQERNNTGSRPEYQPVIRPVYKDMSENGNFFADQATYYFNQISDYLNSNAEEFGITPAGTSLDFNSKDKKIFTSIV